MYALPVTQFYRVVAYWSVETIAVTLFSKFL